MIFMHAQFQKALLAAARSCVAEANRAERLGQRRYATSLRESARSALSELNSAMPVQPVDPATAAQRERARAFAMVIANGLGRLN